MQLRTSDFETVDLMFDKSSYKAKTAVSKSTNNSHQRQHNLVQIQSKVSHFIKLMKET